MRDMKAKFGAQVESFRYSFIIPRHVPGWDEPRPETSTPAPTPDRVPETVSAPRRRATDKRPTFIEIKPREN